MATNNIVMKFDNGPEGTIESKNATTQVSFNGTSFAPYELFLGGYASCLHATFLAVLNKRKIAFDKVEYDVTSVKRDEVPTYIVELVTNVTIYGADIEKKKQIEKSMAQAEKYCSISYTIHNIGADMKLNIEYK
jgi:putative redox protein